MAEEFFDLPYEDLYNQPTVSHAAPQGEVVQKKTTLFSPSTNAMIVEVEGFQLKNDFFVKELAFVNLLTKEYWVGIFLPPYGRQHMKKKYNQELDWCTKHLHGLTWEEGLYPYNVAFMMLNHFGATYQLYTKGKQKVDWIREHTALNVLDLEDIGCPPAKELPFASYCEFHNSLHRSCALDKATRLARHLVTMFSLKNPALLNTPMRREDEEED